MYLCIDIGGTFIKYGIISETNHEIEVFYQNEIPTEAKPLKGPGIRNKIVNLVEEMNRQYRLQGVAISTAGIVDRETGVIVYANENIPEYTGINLKNAVYERFHLPCIVENDVNSAALGEYAFGAAKGAHSVLCLTVGTGIGAALILNNDIYQGFSGSAGEVGYMLINGNQFQDLASTTSLVERVKGRLPEEICINGKVIFERAKQNDSLCIKEITKTCDILALGITNCVCLMNPEIVILGGGIMAQEEILRPIIEEYLQKYLNPAIRQHTKFAFAKLGNQAGLIGAYYKLQQSIKNQNT